MDNLLEILKLHTQRYPLATAKDYLKLILQQEFGAGHLIADADAAMERLKNEWDMTPPNGDAQLFEDIGNGFVRLHLSAAKHLMLSPALIARVFLQSANKSVGSWDELNKKIKILQAFVGSENSPVMTDALEQLLDQWEQDGRPMLSHSNVYREAYTPAYRVMPIEYARLLPVLQRIEMLSQERAISVAIDGRCGAGKSTIATRVSEIFDSSLVHMDDFFLPLELRMQERLSSPGGNIHYERFLDEVLRPLSEKRDFSYRVFDCKTMRLADERRILRKPVTLIEGSYCMHPKFCDPYDVRVFCTVSKIQQQQRITARNGIELWSQFDTRWIPMEELYFKEFTIAEQCDFIIDTTL